MLILVTCAPVTEELSLCTAGQNPRPVNRKSKKRGGSGRLAVGGPRFMAGQDTMGSRNSAARMGGRARLRVLRGKQEWHRSQVQQPEQGWPPGFLQPQPEGPQEPGTSLGVPGSLPSFPRFADHTAPSLEAATPPPTPQGNKALVAAGWTLGPNPHLWTLASV